MSSAVRSLEEHVLRFNERAIGGPKKGELIDISLDDLVRAYPSQEEMWRATDTRLPLDAFPDHMVHFGCGIVTGDIGDEVPRCESCTWRTKATGAWCRQES